MDEMTKAENESIYNKATEGVNNLDALYLLLCNTEEEDLANELDELQKQVERIIADARELI